MNPRRTVIAAGPHPQAGGHAGALTSGWRSVDHTADLAIECWAADEAGLLLEAARAVVSLMTEGAAIEAREERRLDLECLDPEDRLVAWLNEVIVWAITHGFLLADATLELAPERLSGVAWGEAEASERLAGELKAATYHDLALRQDAGRWWCRVVIDV